MGLTNSGVFSESASGAANELVGSVGVGIFTVPIGCTTVEPIQLPLSITEPVNALVERRLRDQDEGHGARNSAAAVCSGRCSRATMSGPGNTIKMTATPPPPIYW